MKTKPNEVKFPLAAGLAILLAVLLASCKTTRFSHSGLTETLTSQEVLQAAGGPNSPKIIHDSLPNGGLRGGKFEFTREFEVLLGSGSSGEFITQYYEAVLKEIFAHGATVHYNAVVSPGDGQLRDFAYSYRWKNNEGLIRLYSARTGSNQLRITLYSYEHHD